MKLVVEAGKTLLVDGPASVSIISGKVEILGALMKAGERVVIREGKRAPIEAKRKVSLNLMLGEGASYNEFEGSTIPASWKTAVKEILGSSRKLLTVMVIGEVDSGKSSFCTYLANMALRKGLGVAVIDGDIGQSDVGPPSTIGYCELTGPIKDLFDVDVKDAYFVGSTSPGRVVERVVKGLTTLRDRFLKKNAGLLIINTDGWIQGEDAARYKRRLIQVLEPNVVVGIQRERELTHIFKDLKGTKLLVVDSPLAVRRRNREKRRTLRELSYKKHLRGGKVRSFLMSWLKIEDTPLGKGTVPNPERMGKIKEVLKTRPWYCEETSKVLLLVLGRGQSLFDEDVEKLERLLGKKVKAIRDGEEEGLLVALKNAEGRFLGIGILRGINYRRGAIKIYTPVKGGIHAVQIGQIRLDRDGKETGTCQAFARLEA